MSSRLGVRPVGRRDHPEKPRRPCEPGYGRATSYQPETSRAGHASFISCSMDKIYTGMIKVPAQATCPATPLKEAGNESCSRVHKGLHREARRPQEDDPREGPRVDRRGRARGSDPEIHPPQEDHPRRWRAEKSLEKTFSVNLFCRVLRDTAFFSPEKGIQYHGTILFPGRNSP